METTIERLAAAAGRYTGSGDGVEIGPYDATIDVRPILDGLGVEIVYEGVADGERRHLEHTVLTYDMMSGEPTLYVLCTELAGMAALRQIAQDRYGNGAGRDGFELQVDLVVDDDQLVHTWSWGPPQQDLTERSHAVVRRQR